METKKNRHVFIKGLHGCPMRTADLTQYADFLTANGHRVVDQPEESDVILLWTCAFRGDFRDNSLKEIHRYMNTYKAELIVAGCLPDIDRQLLETEYAGRFFNWRNQEEALEAHFGAAGKKFSDIPRQLSAGPLTDDLDQYRKEHPDKDISFSDQFIKLFVSEGCRFKCSYCSEILAFPRYRSFPEAALIEECKRQVQDTGRNEVVLMGDSIADYGCDTGSTLPQLIRKLKSEIPSLRIALLGFNPAGFIRYFNDMAEFIRNGWIRHMQLPIPSASPRILRLMNRPYRREHIDKIFSALNNLHFADFETHIIVGFPGEEEEDFEETIRFILKHRPRYVLASQYMESPTMPSAKLPCKVDPGTKSRRARDAVRQLTHVGILCNADESELSVARFRKLNQIEEKEGNRRDLRRSA